MEIKGDTHPSIICCSRQGRFPRNVVDCVFRDVIQQYCFPNPLYRLVSVEPSCFYTAEREARDSNTVPAPRAPHPGSNRRGSGGKLLYSYVNESRGHIWTHPVCKGLADSGVGKRRMHISGLSMEEVSSSGP